MQNFVLYISQPLNFYYRLCWQVDACFHRIAGHLAGIALTRSQLEAAGGVIAANIVNHRRHDDGIHGGEVPDYTDRRSKNCTLS